MLAETFPSPALSALPAQGKEDPGREELHLILLRNGVALTGLVKIVVVPPGPSARAVAGQAFGPVEWGWNRRGERKLLVASWLNFTGGFTCPLKGSFPRWKSSPESPGELFHGGKVPLARRGKFSTAEKFP